MSETNCSTCSRTGRNWTIVTCCGQPFCVDEHYQHSRTGPPEPSCFQLHYTDEHTAMHLTPVDFDDADDARDDERVTSDIDDIDEADYDDEYPSLGYRSLED